MYRGHSILAQIIQSLIWHNLRNVSTFSAISYLLYFFWWCFLTRYLVHFLKSYIYRAEWIRTFFREWCMSSSSLCRGQVCIYFCAKMSTSHFTVPLLCHPDCWLMLSEVSTLRLRYLWSPIHDMLLCVPWTLFSCSTSRSNWKLLSIVPRLLSDALTWGIPVVLSIQGFQILLGGNLWLCNMGLEIYCIFPICLHHRIV